MTENSHKLTPRELAVLALVAEGRADKQIGFDLGISPLTARKHVQHIRRKMGASCRTEASVRAVRAGLLP
jgi:DNA-binding NarL/FixJ family response regulator